MRENRPYGSEGGERKTFPTPIPRAPGAGAMPLRRITPYGLRASRQPHLAGRAQGLHLRSGAKLTARGAFGWCVQPLSARRGRALV